MKKVGFEIVNAVVANSFHGRDIPNGTVFTAVQQGCVIMCVKSCTGDRISIVHSNGHNSGDSYISCKDTAFFDNYKVVNKITVEV